MINDRKDSLRIETVQAGRGSIGMTLCPGKKQRGALSGDWNRDLDQDLGEIVRWGASSVVSVMENAELLALGVPDLGEKVEGFGLNWHHLPVADVDVPNANFEALWVYAGHCLRSALSTGKKILIHCKGGLGRTGTVAARLLVELGVPHDHAIVEVREARPGAIETKEQEAYVRKFRSVRPTEHAYADRVLGCLLGGAVGDAFGYEIEFARWNKIRDRFGPQGLIEPQIHHGVVVVSDDTQMTLFTLEGLLRGLRSPTTSIIDEIRRGYLDWLTTQGLSESGWTPAGTLCHDSRLRYSRAPGNTCLSALKTGRAVAGSKGCGGVMRVAPLGLTRRWSVQQAFELGSQSAGLTHGHPTGYLSAGALASMVRALLDGVDLTWAAKEALSILESKPDSSETRRALHVALRRQSNGDSLPAVKHLGEGWTGEEALSIGLYSALLGRSFPEVLTIAANHDGDSDSTASIAGQIYGAWRGIGELPHRWIRRLDVLVPLLKLAGDLLESESDILKNSFAANTT